VAAELALAVTHVHRSAVEADKQRLDELAERILTALAPLSFATAGSPGQVDAVPRMRYECVVEMGWAAPEDYPDGRERDEYDDEAIHVVARDAGDIVGSLRLVLPSAGRLLPTERDFGIRVEPPGDALEGGRIVVPRRYRLGRSHRLIAGLFARSWLVARSLSFDRAISVAAPNLVDLYRSLGVRVRVCSAPRGRTGASSARPSSSAGRTTPSRPYEGGCSAHHLQTSVGPRPVVTLTAGGTAGTIRPAGRR
jgi:N-acyl-L-homoserine lactone synthetase